MHQHRKTPFPPLSSACRRCGAVIVELAFILPVFLMLLTGIVEFGRAMTVSRMVAEAAQYGARLAIVEGSTNREVQSAVEDFLRESVGAVDVTVTTTITPAPGNTDPGNDLSEAQARDQCRVVVAVPFDQVSYFPASYLGDRQLEAFSTLSHE